MIEWSIVIVFGISIVLLVYNYQNNSSRWLALLIMTVGFACVAVYINDHNGDIMLSPYLNGFYYPLKFLEYLSASLSHYGAPYFFLMFSFSNAPASLRRGKLLNSPLTPLIFLAPVVFMYVKYPITGGFYPNVQVMSSWASLYFVTGLVLMFLSYRYYRQFEESRQQQLIYCIMVVPAALFSLVFNHLCNFFPALIGLWRYGIALIIIDLMVLFYIFIKYGFDGLTLRMERFFVSERMSSATESVMTLCHALKNQLLLEKYELENLAESLVPDSERDSVSLLEMTRSIQGKHQYLIGFIDELTRKLVDINIIRQKCRLFALVEDSLRLIEGNPEHNRHRFARELLGDDLEIFCDRYQLTEVMLNILKNAVEAMEAGGDILVKCYSDGNKIFFVVKDQGVGIPRENLSKITEPLFSTKGEHNYGIGLSYCYNVINQHNGRLLFDSKPAEGTTVTVEFSRKHLCMDG